MRRWVVSALVLVFACVFLTASTAGGAAPERKVPRWYDPEDPFCTRPWLEYPVGEVPALRGLCVRHTQNPDYTITAEVFQRPIHYLTAEGRYLPIDDTLVPGPAPGVYVNRSNSMRVEVLGRGPSIARVSQGGRHIEVAADGSEFNLVKVEGNSATFADTNGRQAIQVYADADRLVIEVRNDSEGGLSLLFRHSEGASFGVTVPQVAVGGRKMVSRPELLETLPGLYRVTVPAGSDEGPTILSVGTIQPGPTTGKDAEVDSEDPDATYSGPTVWIGYFAMDGIMRGYFQFDVSSIQRDAYVEEAELQLYQDTANGSSCTLVPYRPTSSWSDDTITWNNQPSLTGALTGVACDTADGWKTWDISPYFRNWLYNTEYGNYGVCLRQNSETNPAYRVFFTSEVANTSVRPKLVVTYTRLSRKFFDPTTNNDYVPDSGGTTYYLPYVSSKTLGPLRTSDANPTATDYTVGIASPCGAPRYEGSSPHCGLDLGGAWGRQVYAVAAGTVWDVNATDPSDESGLWVRVLHDVSSPADGKYEFVSFYCHLSQVLVSGNQIVSQTTPVGLVGNTGGVQTHLHLSLRTADSAQLYLPQVEFWDNYSGYNSGKDVDAIHEPYIAGSYLKVVAYRISGSTPVDYSRVYVYHRRQGTTTYYAKKAMTLGADHTWSANMSSYAGTTRDLYICVERDVDGKTYRSYRPMYYAAGTPTDYMVPPPDSGVCVLSF